MCSITPPMKVRSPSDDAVDVALDGVVQEAVQQHRRIVRDLDRLAHVALEVALLVHDLHRAAAQHVAGTHHQRVAQRLRLLQRLGLGARGGVGRLAQAEFLQQLLEALAVLGGVDHVGRGADDGHAFGLQAQRQLQRRLAAVLHDHAGGLFLVDDLQHVFQRQRLEVQAVGGVVVGGHRLRVAVDHDGLVAVLAQRQGGVHAAVVELDALADAVGPAAQHHDLLAVGRLGLALVLVGRVHVGGVGGEFRGAGVHALVDRAHAQLLAQLAHGLVGGLEQLGQAAVGEALALEQAQRGVARCEGALALRRRAGPARARSSRSPRSAPGTTCRSWSGRRPRRPTGPAEGIAHVPDALGTGLAQFLLQHLAVLRLLVHAVDADFEAAQAFWNDSWKVRPMAITSPTDFICVVRRESACGNFSKAKRGILVTT
jgi:hypothetical protein